MTPSEQAMNEKFDSTLKTYRLNKSCENAAEVRKMVKEYLLISRRRDPIAAIGPTLGILEGLNEDHSHDITWIKRAWMYAMRRALKPERSGWNYYWMARWMTTGNSDCLREIHRRAFHLRENWTGVQETCQWMVGSYRQSNSDFHYQMGLVERDCQMCGGMAQ